MSLQTLMIHTAAHHSKSHTKSGGAKVSSYTLVTDDLRCNFQPAPSVINENTLNKREQKAAVMFLIDSEAFAAINKGDAIVFDSIQYEVTGKKNALARHVVFKIELLESLSGEVV